MLKDDQIRILMLVHELESTLGGIYQQFSDSFPEHNDLWNTLVKEEREHAEAARKLYQLSYEGQSAFNDGGIKPEAVQAILDYLRGVHDNVKRGKYTAHKAVSLACEVENLIIEKAFFNRFSVSRQYGEMLQMLINGTKTHAQLARMKLDEIGGKKA